MLWGIYSAIYGEVDVSVEKCVEIKGGLCWKIAKLFYFCRLKKLVRPETYGPYHVFKNVKNISDTEYGHFSDKFINSFKIYSKNTLRTFCTKNTTCQFVFWSRVFSSIIKMAGNMKERVIRSNYNKINYWYEFRIEFSQILCTSSGLWGHAVKQLVEALRYSPEGHGFDSR